MKFSNLFIRLWSIMIFLLLWNISFSQCDTIKEYSKNKVFGTYRFFSDENGGTRYKLKIKRDSTFIFHVNSHLESVFYDEGKWGICNDSLFLFTNTRSEMGNGWRYEKRKYNLVRKYKIGMKKLCGSYNFKEMFYECCLIR